MDKIIGLGSAGCKIADQFLQFPQYEIYKIDINLKGDNCFCMEQKSHPEEYERSVPNMESFFKNLKGDILFIIGGGGKISGASLQILKQIKNCNINILYIRPYTKSLTKTAYLQERLTFGVLQEYARSGLFKKIFLVDNTKIENIIGDVPILEYNQKLNEIIVNTFHYINIFNHTEPLISNIEPPKDNQRILTIGIFDLKDNSEKTFFELENIGHKCYYYAVPEAILKSDGKLFKLIKDKAAEEQSSYQIHTTKHENSFAFFIAQTSFIQSVDISV